MLQEIMQDAKQGAFDILLAYMSDRIGRQEEYSFYVNLCGAFVHPHRKDIVTKKELYNMSDNDFYILVE